MATNLTTRPLYSLIDKACKLGGLGYTNSVGQHFESEDHVKEFGPSTFGELNAEDYDELHDPGTTDECVNLIAELAGSGTVLELAVGTGRIALPLTERGLSVHGIEGSERMVSKLKAKPGGESIPVVVGDFADVAVDGTYDFVFLVFNTLFNLTSQDDQVRCFHNVAERLRDGGAFLVEAVIPDVGGFQDGYRVRTKHVDFGSAWLEAAKYDPVRQLIEFQRIRITNEGVKLVPLPMRYAWPSEIDLMAQLAGLKLKYRWGGWDRTEFTSKSKMHISVYEKPVG